MNAKLQPIDIDRVAADGLKELARILVVEHKADPRIAAAVIQQPEVLAANRKAMEAFGAVLAAIQVFMRNNNTGAALSAAALAHDEASREMTAAMMLALKRALGIATH